MRSVDALKLQDCKRELFEVSTMILQWVSGILDKMGYQTDQNNSRINEA